MKQKPKTCKVCRERFVPTISTLQATCTKVSCVLQYAKRSKAKEASEEIKRMREKIKTLSDYRRELQQVFNKFIRLRDKDKPCISCSRKLGTKYDAGHYFSVGSYPNLRFDEDNVHGQCVECNQHKHGNLIEYGERLQDRIGEEAFDKLYMRRTQSLRLSVDQMKELIKIYKSKIKNT
jgi:gamma-glutamylcyclotransferase (GGCT)/AIG2-like uncharacterized protein YtfP